jgi:hypothetical protein
MSDPVTTASCPNGHTSIDRVFCSVCGTPIGGPVRLAGDSLPTTATPIVAGRPPAASGGPPDSPSPWDQMATPERPADAPDLSGPTGPTGPAPARPAEPPAPFEPFEPFEPAEPFDSTGGTGPTGPAGRPGAPAPGATPEQAGPGRLPRRLGPPAEPGPANGGGSDRGPHGAGGPLGAGGVCPHCAAQLDEGSRFCEVCGYDPTTGSLPEAPAVRPAAAPPPAPEPAPVARPLVAVITADRAYYESHQVSEVQFPLGMPPRTIELPPGSASIGRRSRSRGTNPEIDLGGPPDDPAVSHTHASLLPKDDGTWELVDHGSTNGTYLNESPDPVPANRPVPVATGDRIYLGAWTRITLEHRRP